MSEGKHFDINTKENAWKYGMSMEEISIVLDIPLSTVKTILYRALRKLKHNYEVKNAIMLRKNQREKSVNHD